MDETIVRKAVGAYGQVLIAEANLERAEKNLGVLVGTMPPEEYREYVKRTQERDARRNEREGAPT